MKFPFKQQDNIVGWHSGQNKDYYTRGLNENEAQENMLTRFILLRLDRVSRVLTGRTSGRYFPAINLKRGLYVFTASCVKNKH